MFADRSRWFLLSLLALALLPLGCPGTLDDPEAFLDAAQATCPAGYDVEKDLFQSTCGASACHDATQPTGNLDLASPNVASRLIGVPASDPKCASKLLVNPKNPDSSFLLEKLESSKPSCGVQMPKGSKPLAPAQIACVKQWIYDQLGVGDAGKDAAKEGGNDAKADAPSDATSDVGGG